MSPIVRVDTCYPVHGAARFETLLVGHGEPILAGASAQVAALAAAG